MVGSNDGWVKLHRKIMDSGIWPDADLVKLFVLCLCEASHKERTVSIAGQKQPVAIQPGQFITGRESLHCAFYPRKRKRKKCAKTVWRWLQVLENMQNLTIKSSKQYSIVTICNWETYQNAATEDVQEDVQRLSNACPTVVQRMSTYNKDKNVKNGKELEETFVQFWETYGYKVGKQEAQVAFAKINPSPELLTEIMAGVKRRRTLQSGWPNEKKLHPATFLNKRRWTDEPGEDHGQRNNTPASNNGQSPPQQSATSTNATDWDQVAKDAG